ncbi:MAG: hypothetical protein WDM86_00355 [Rhizomicrobium sp.]
MSGSGALVLGLTLLVAGATAAWSVWSWRRLKPTLFPQAASATSASTFLPDRIGASGILNLASSWIEAEGTPVGHSAGTCLGRLRKNQIAIKDIDQQIAKALATDDASSVLARTEEGYAYFVVVPERFENARAIGRYAGFANGWGEHLRALEAELSHPGAEVRINAFTLFVDSEQGDAALFFSLAEGGCIVAPRMLDTSPSSAAVPKEARAERDGKLVMEFQLAA